VKHNTKPPKYRTITTTVPQRVTEWVGAVATSIQQECRLKLHNPDMMFMFSVSLYRYQAHTLI